jgi:predicted MPP superfamily phosphohydrolase
MKKMYFVSLFIVLLFAGNLHAAEISGNAGDKYPRFAVISDTHFGHKAAKEKVSRTLQVLLSKKPLVDAIFVVGDLTDNGKPEQYDDLMETFAANVPQEVPVYFMIATSHDHSSGSEAENTYLAKTGQPLHQYVVLKDYPFITLSQGFRSANGDYDEGGVDFLSTHLAQASKDHPKKPIFVFMHVGLLNTAYGTWVHEGWGTDQLRPFLTPYPQIILFAGHSHYPLGDPRSIHQEQITAINTGSSYYSEIEDGFTEGGHPPGHGDVTEGIIVNVKPNGDVVLERWDTFRDEEIKPHWLVKAPHDGSAFGYKNQTGGSAPRFAKKALPTVSDVTTESCLVTFPQAKDDEVVHHYIVEAVPADGAEPVSVTVFSRFYLNSATPETLSYQITGLRNGTTYVIKVTAVDSFKNQSTAIVSEKFGTK